MDSCSALSVQDRRGLAALSRPHVSLQCCQSCPGSTLYLVGISSLLLVPEWCLWLICCETDHFDHAGSVPRDRLSYHPDGPGVWSTELWHPLPPWWQVHRACIASPACELCLLATPCFERRLEVNKSREGLCSICEV